MNLQLSILPPALHRRRARAGAFTLVELLVVIVIVAIISGLIMATFRGLMGTQLAHKAVADIEAIRAGIEQYQKAWGSYPPADMFGGEVSGPNRALVQCLSLDCHALPETDPCYKPADDPRRGPFIAKYLIEDKDRFQTRDLGGGAALYWLDPWGNPYIYFERNSIREYTLDEAPRYHIMGMAIDAGSGDGSAFQPRKDDEGIFYGVTSFQVWSCGPDGRSTFDGAPGRSAEDDLTSWGEGL